MAGRTGPVGFATNEPALAIRSMLQRGVQRVFYIDLDAHQGDGVQDAFADEPRVFTLSVHEAGRWPMEKTALSGDLGTVEDSRPCPSESACFGGVQRYGTEYLWRRLCCR